jgi:hypothetical protein
MKVPDLSVGKRLFVGLGEPTCLGVGPLEARGSAYIEGPVVMGNPTSFPVVNATVMIGPNINSESTVPLVAGSLCVPIHNPYSLCVSGDAAIFDNLDVNLNIAAGANIIAQGEVMSRCGGHILSAKKNFDIPHPSRKGYRLRHTCPEAPYNDVYIRGRITNKNKIELPIYWKDFVNIESISVQLQPIGSHQDIIIKRIDEQYVHLQSKGGMPIDCYYHIFGERKDGEKLIPEYKGSSPADYPGNNNEYSVSGYHYDVKEE